MISEDDIRGFKIWSSTSFVIFYKFSFHLVSTHKKKNPAFHFGSMSTYTYKCTLRFTSHQSVQLCLKMLQYMKPKKKSKNHDHEKCDAIVVSIDSIFPKSQKHKHGVKRKGLTVCISYILAKIFYVIQSIEDADQRPWSLQYVMLFLSLYSYGFMQYSVLILFR